MGRTDEAGLRDSLSEHPLGNGDTAYPPIYAVDVSVWPRCDAEASPGRGDYYHPSRPSAGQPIVAGWGYQLVAQLRFRSEEHPSALQSRQYLVCRLLLDNKNKSRYCLIRVRNIRALNGRFNTSITHAYSIDIGSKHITFTATGGGFLTASTHFRHGATSK